MENGLRNGTNGLARLIFAHWAPWLIGIAFVTGFRYVQMDYRIEDLERVAAAAETQHQRIRDYCDWKIQSYKESEDKVDWSHNQRLTVLETEMFRETDQINANTAKLAGLEARRR